MPPLRAFVKPKTTKRTPPREEGEEEDEPNPTIELERKKKSADTQIAFEERVRVVEAAREVAREDARKKEEEARAEARDLSRHESLRRVSEQSLAAHAVTTNRGVVVTNAHELISQPDEIFNQQKKDIAQAFAQTVLTTTWQDLFTRPVFNALTVQLSQTEGSTSKDNADPSSYKNIERWTMDRLFEQWNKLLVLEKNANSTTMAISTQLNKLRLTAWNTKGIAKWMLQASEIVEAADLSTMSPAAVSALWRGMLKEGIKGQPSFAYLKQAVLAKYQTEFQSTEVVSFQDFNVFLVGYYRSVQAAKSLVAETQGPGPTASDKDDEDDLLAVLADACTICGRDPHYRNGKPSECYYKAYPGANHNPLFSWLTSDAGKRARTAVFSPGDNDNTKRDQRDHTDNRGRGGRDGGRGGGRGHDRGHDHKRQRH